MEKQNNFNNLKRKYSTITRIVNQEYARFGVTNDLKEMIDEMNLTLINNSNQIQKILQKSHLELILERRMENILLYVFKSEKYNILHLQTPFEEFIIIDKDEQNINNNTIIFIIFLFLFTAILFIAYIIYKKLSPLYELHSKIDHIGDQNMHLDFLKKDAKDEVSLLASALLEKSKNLNQLKNARDVFIRNIMHELKTPITKGRFLVELESTQKNKEKLAKVFFQLESLISEFAVIEEVIAKKENIIKKDIFFNDILENSTDMLLIDNDTKVQVNENNTKVNVNFKLFSIVVKNLIDNALKYSTDNKVSIVVTQNSITFKNSGTSLKDDLEKYYEPFYTTQTNNKESFGLGLYIIKSILDVHNFKLQYSYEDNTNTFTIVL